jgi:hypothetical protein
VELRDVGGALVKEATAVRDSKNPAGPVLVLPAEGWRALTRYL